MLPVGLALKPYLSGFGLCIAVLHAELSVIEREDIIRHANSPSDKMIEILIVSSLLAGLEFICTLAPG
jgi:hypothetical protein